MALMLLTNVTQYTGPGALTALLRDGHTVMCHDPSFQKKTPAQHSIGPILGLTHLRAKPPKTSVPRSRTQGLAGCIVSNDVYPITPNEIETIPVDDFRATFEAVVMFPIQLTQHFLPPMEARKSGAFVFVTSARDARPEPGFAVPTTLRAAATAFAKSLSKEAAPFGIQANVVAPNYLYSEMYYPKARFIDSPEGRQLIARTVPFGRLGQPEEVGALISLLASGKSPFTTGQVIHFTGGWP